jgi:hypothetical protein
MPISREDYEKGTDKDIVKAFFEENNDKAYKTGEIIAELDFPPELEDWVLDILLSLASEGYIERKTVRGFTYWLRKI